MLARELDEALQFFIVIEQTLSCRVGLGESVDADFLGRERRGLMTEMGNRNLQGPLQSLLRLSQACQRHEHHRQRKENRQREPLPGGMLTQDHEKFGHSSAPVIPKVNSLPTGIVE